MKLVTVATQSEWYFPWLKKSCERHNQDLTILGWGQKWQGFVWRFKLMLNYLQTLPPDEIVCFIDGYDVLLLRPLDELEQMFKKLTQNTNYKIIIAYEDIKILMNQITAKLMFGGCKKTYINAGTYIGYAKDIYAILKEMYETNGITDKSDDQVLLSSYCRTNPDNLYIDLDGEIFATIVDTDVSQHLKIKNNQIIYRNQQPFFLHAPGLGCMNDIIKLLGYDMNDEEIRSLKKYRIHNMIKKQIYYFKHQLQYFIIFIIIILVIRKIWKRG